MRNTSGPDRGNWATYSRVHREAAGMTKAALARRLGVDRGTIHRWETAQSRPENGEVVQLFTQIFGLDLDEGLAAAGLRPGGGEPAEVVEPYDEELELVRTDSRLAPETKMRIIELILRRREEDRAASMAETRRIIDIMRDTG